MEGAQASMLADGRRLHLHHGPIDLIIEAWGQGRSAAYARAQARFDTVLEDLVNELSDLRMQSVWQAYGSCDLTRKMYATVSPFSNRHFVTPMACVAGAVAEEILGAMGTDGLDRAYVNNGGDIALFLTPGFRFEAAMPGGKVAVRSEDGIRGIATSGWGGRSYSFGIADSVTVLARSAALADVAATLIANAVDLDHPGIRRVPACDLSPDSDLGARLVTRHVPPLTDAQRAEALQHGVARAQDFRRRGLIAGAALTLQGQTRTVAVTMKKELTDA